MAVRGPAPQSEVLLRADSFLRLQASLSLQYTVLFPELLLHLVVSQHVLLLFGPTVQHRTPVMQLLLQHPLLFGLQLQLQLQLLSLLLMQLLAQEFVSRCCRLPRCLMQRHAGAVLVLTDDGPLCWQVHTFFQLHSLLLLKQQLSFELLVLRLPQCLLLLLQPLLLMQLLL